MRAFQEITDWGEHNTPNHIYYLTDNKENLVAFYNVSTGEVKKFIKPIRFDMRYRKFKELKHK
jgi:hypothetical protein